MLRSPDGNVQYTRLGEFTFDSEGVYRAKSGATVQGYILNDKGEIMSGTKSLSADLYEETALKGGALSVPTTNIKLWIDPNNGKFLGKYDEYEIKMTVQFTEKLTAAIVLFRFIKLRQQTSIIQTVYMKLKTGFLLKLLNPENR